MQAVMKQATLPAIMALSTSPEMSERRLGAMPPSAPSISPMEARLEKPHNAYVAITTVRSWKTQNVHRHEYRSALKRHYRELYRDT